MNALRSQLSWTHFRELLSLDDSLKRDFYAEMCRVERWSTRTLKHKIAHLLYERTAISKKPEDLIEQDITALRDEDRLTPDMVFRDPYFLDFLGLGAQHAEKDVEDAILRVDLVTPIQKDLAGAAILKSRRSAKRFINETCSEAPRSPSAAPMVGCHRRPSPKAFTEGIFCAPGPP